MPLQDHFHQPLSLDWPWKSLHSTWVPVMMGQLNQTTLPANYRALPGVHVSTQVEIDVATVRLGEATKEADGNGVATAVWAPPQVRLAALVDFTDRDTFEVKVQEMPGRRLVAAIELVSPANKDHRSTRRDFVVKCASYLQQRIAVVILDVVTERRANLHRELMQFLDMPAEFREAVASHLYAVSYRIRLRDDERDQLELWPETLTVNAELPTVPLWIAADLAVPVHLETSYRVACQMLGIK